MNGRTLILAAVLVIVVVAGYLYMMPQDEVMQPESVTTSEPAETTSPSTGTE